MRTSVLADRAHFPVQLRHMRPWLLWLVCLLLLHTLCACLPQTATTAPEFPTPPPTQTQLPEPTHTPIPSATAVTPTPTATPLPALALCSPLAGVALESLPDLVSNTYNPPPLGSDLPHQGVDLALLDPATRIALSGHTVQAVFAGRVAMVINDRFPYGNAILIETPIEKGYEDFWTEVGVPAPEPTLEPRSALTCPEISQPLAYQPKRRAVYVLYAHLQSLEAFTPGQEIACGQPLGAVGMSGNALNPHLHIEIRAAPAGILLGSMAHYDPTASQDEMAAYCLWRVSGLFQRVNPLQALFR